MRVGWSAELAGGARPFAYSWRCAHAPWACRSSFPNYQPGVPQPMTGGCRGATVMDA